MEIDKLDYSLKDFDIAEGKQIEALRAQCQEPIPGTEDWLDEEVRQNVITSSVARVLNWGRHYSTWPLGSGLACCAMEMVATSASRFDMTRFGMDVFRASPRQADLFIVAGTLTWKMAPAVRRLWEQMAEPKWVLAMGACAISGGTFAHSYSVVPGVNRIIPVDVYVPGCPPRPEALIYGVMLLHKKIDKRRFRQQD